MRSQTALANTLMQRGELSEGARIHRETLAVRRRVLGEEHRCTLTSMNNLGTALNDAGQHAEAAAVCKAAPTAQISSLCASGMYLHLTRTRAPPYRTRAPPRTMPRLPRVPGT